MDVVNIRRTVTKIFYCSDASSASDYQEPCTGNKLLIVYTTHDIDKIKSQKYS